MRENDLEVGDVITTRWTTCGCKGRIIYIEPDDPVIKYQGIPCYQHMGKAGQYTFHKSSLFEVIPPDGMDEFEWWVQKTRRRSDSGRINTIE